MGGDSDDPGGDLFRSEGMGMTKIEKMHRKLNDNFRDHLKDAVLKKYSVEIITEYVFLAERLITKKVDGSEFTPAQIQWIAAFSNGYEAAMSQVYEATP